MSSVSAETYAGNIYSGDWVACTAFTDPQKPGQVTGVSVLLIYPAHASPYPRRSRGSCAEERQQSSEQALSFIAMS